MKKALRSLVPILLAIAVVCCALWYLFVYDRDFTRDMLLQQARYFEREGKHSIATWFYDQAYAHSSQEDAVAIELAEQYKAAGNYTKAEYTLSNAIADGATTNLYVALCKTYVEQDKLLDAVNMLDNIPDPVIKAELDAMRPASPAVSPDPGFYSQYICVSVSSASGTLYVSTNGEYPSTEDVPYSEPVALGDGETTIYAIAVADNGLVSPLSIYGYTIGGVVEQVSFDDPAMEAEIRSILAVSDTTTLYTNDLWGIDSFIMPQEAQTYSDLAKLPYLTSLTIENGVSSDELQYISSLTYLEELNLRNCRPDEELVSAIGSLPALEKLTMSGCSLSTISGLENAQNLTYLDLSSNTIRNITPLSGLSKLQEVHLAHNALTDLSALSALNGLQILDVSYNSLPSISPVASLVNMTWLNIGYNIIADLSPIGNLDKLEYLDASHNVVTDASVLAQCTCLKQLYISNNALTDITMLSTLKNLTHFDFSYNQVTALPALGSNCALITIDGSYNLLSSLEELRGMKNLNNVLMDYNEEIESVEPLVSCPVLIQVNVYGTKVTDVSDLTRQSIVVNYNPVASNE